MVAYKIVPISTVDRCFRIERELLPTFVTWAFQPRHPENRGHAHEQRVVATCLPTQALRPNLVSVSIIERSL